MKITTFLLLSALLAPATLLVGLTGPVAFGLTTVFGLSAIMFADYGTPAHRGYQPTRVKASRTESHPFAA